ncbi:hypothetical protein HK104_003550 [Borealophlyctis nickersoniae]|nr:hypothetical protein HK104_003550 [Borealophlyctis nickersoniae]
MVSPEVVATNTIILTSLPPHAFDNGGAHIRKLVEQFGPVSHAVRAKSALDRTQFLGQQLRVYFGEHTDTDLLNPEEGKNLNYLRVPEIEKNFLLSPPGSPPIGWVQSREGGPVPGGHADALMDALAALEGDPFILDEGPLMNDQNPSAAVDADRHVLRFIPPDEEMQLPMIIVENADAGIPPVLVTSEDPPEIMRPPTPLPKTAMPPVC